MDALQHLHEFREQTARHGRSSELWPVYLPSGGQAKSYPTNSNQSHAPPQDPRTTSDSPGVGSIGTTSSHFTRSRCEAFLNDDFAWPRLFGLWATTSDLRRSRGST